MANLQEIGQTLKEAREAMGLSLEDLANRTHVSLRHLRAIEDGNEADLPEVFYVRGFLKKYAEAVGLSPTDVADAYSKAPIPTPTEPSMRYAVGPIAYYLLIVVVIVGVLALAWHFQPHVSVVSAPSPTPHATVRPTPTPKPKPAIAASGTAKPSAKPVAGASGTPSVKPGKAASAAASPKPSAKPSPKASAAPSPKPSAKPSAASPTPSAKPSARAAKTSQVQLTLHVANGQQSWLEVTVDGGTAYRDMANPGTLTFKGHKVTVYAGNAGAVSVSLNGKNQGALGGPSEVVERTYPK